MVVMISGLKSRFTYLSDIANYTHISTIVIALHENHQSVDTESFSGSVKGKPRRPPYPLDEISIARHYKQLGVSTVVIRTFTSAQIDAYGTLSEIYKDPALNLFPSDPTRTIRNLRMLTLRSMAYAMACEVRPDFKLLLYKREDNYFLDGGRFKVDNVRMFCRGERETLDSVCVCVCVCMYVCVVRGGLNKPVIPSSPPNSHAPSPLSSCCSTIFKKDDDEYCYLVDKHCKQASAGHIFGGFSDKVRETPPSPSTPLRPSNPSMNNFTKTTLYTPPPLDIPSIPNPRPSSLFPTNPILSPSPLVPFLQHGNVSLHSS
jgi:hypothetical protein